MSNGTIFLLTIAACGGAVCVVIAAITWAFAPPSVGASLPPALRRDRKVPAHLRRYTA